MASENREGAAHIGVTGVSLGLLLALAVRTAIVLATLYAGVRVFGLRLAGELRTIDILMILVAGNAVQNSMTRSDGHLTVSLISTGTLILLGWLLGLILRDHPRLQQPLIGAPVVLVSHGQILWRNLRRQGLTLEDLQAAMRQRGLTDLADVRLAVLEMVGTISVVPVERPETGMP